MSEFKRENRYIVIKRSDLKKVPVAYRSSLVDPMFHLLSHLPRREFLVIESDWPEYEPTWRAIEERVTNRGPDPAEGTHVPDDIFAAEFARWWEGDGQYCRAGGGDYERTFAFQAWRHLYPQLMTARAALAQDQSERSLAMVETLPPFAEKVLSKLRRFEECVSDFESGGVDIGRHWLDLLTQLGLLNRVQRSPALWEISQQGEDLLESPAPLAGPAPKGYALIPTRLLLDKEVIESIAFHCGDGGGSYGDYQDGILFIGEITDDDGRQVHGLHLACAECEEEGYTTLVEFAAAPAKGGSVDDSSND